MQTPKVHQRLVSRKQFREVYEKGQKFSTAFFSAFILSRETEHQRLGLTTTRKIGNAVVRNRCRRRMREIFRLRNQNLLSGIGYDLVINPRSSVATAEYQDLENAFAQLLLRYRQTLNKAIINKDGKGVI